MENAVDALIMAGQFLLFIIALSVCMSSFSRLRIQTNDIFTQGETIELAKDKSNDSYINYIASKNSKSNRVVGAETVVSSMYRAIKEDYVIYLILNDTSGVTEEADVIVFTDVNVYNYESKSYENKKAIKITIGKKEIDEVNQNVNEILKKGLYDKIRNLSFYEYLGEYQDPGEEVSSENKLTKRIITFKQKA